MDCKINMNALTILGISLREEMRTFIEKIGE